MKEEYKLKEKKETKKEKKKNKKQQRKMEMKVMELRAIYMQTFLKKKKEGDKYFLKWKDIEIGEYLGSGNPQIMIDKINKSLIIIKVNNNVYEKNNYSLGMT